MENCRNIRVRWFVDELLENSFALCSLQRGAKELLWVYNRKREKGREDKVVTESIIVDGREKADLRY